ncbi:MAG: transposase [Comamonadaceae bacterium]|nr:transposase [Comamonadaceae bacterium]
MLTDARGCPVAVSVHEGNTADSTTFMPEVQRLRTDFGIEHMVMVGDRGMISQKAIDEMQASDGVGWITALKSASIRALIEQGQLQLGLFDERNLLELQLTGVSRRAPGGLPQSAAGQAARTQARRIAVRDREEPREDQGSESMPAKLAGQDAIGVRVGKVINQYKVAKHFELTIGEATFSFRRKPESIAAEAALDGLYIIRTSVPARQMEAADCVRNYKSLANVERAFRSLKTIDLKVRPIHHRLAERVRAHIFLCMLAYYVEWHMREAWRELMFADTDQQAKATRDPVAPAVRSAAALDQGSPATPSTTAPQRTASAP